MRAMGIGNLDGPELDMGGFIGTGGWEEDELVGPFIW